MVFEGEKTQIFFFRAPQVKFQSSVCLRGRDGSPKQPRRSSQFIKPDVGAPVFIVDNVTESQRKNRGDGSIACKCQANLQRAACVFNQVSEPLVRNRGKMVAPPRCNKQSVKLLQQFPGLPALFRDASSLRPLNAALDRVFVKTGENFIEVWMQIKNMMKVNGRG